MRRPWLLALATAVIAFGATACGTDGDGNDGEAALDLTIGALAPSAGDLAELGPAGKKAADLALDEIAAAIEDVGADHSVRIRHADESGGPDAAVSAARRLADEGASCIAGAWDSAASVAIAESVAIPGGVLLISPAATSAELTDLDDQGLVSRTVPGEDLDQSESADPPASEAPKAFERLFTSSAPRDVDRARFDAQSFDAVVLCYLAAVAARSTDGAKMAEVLPDVTGPDGDEYTWEELPDAIEALEDGDDIDYVGASGEIDLDVNGDPTVASYGGAG